MLARVPETGITSQGGTGNNALLNIAGSLATPFCHQATPFQTQLKALGMYTIPRVDVQLAAAFRNIPGPMLVANFVVPTAAVQPSLGRPLAGNAANVTVSIVEPASLYGDRMYQTDVRLGKIIRFARSRRMTASVDLFNVFNADAVLEESSNYSSFRRPTIVLGARVLKFTVSANF